jgi:hypothetical protein
MDINGVESQQVEGLSFTESTVHRINSLQTILAFKHELAG